MATRFREEKLLNVLLFIVNRFESVGFHKAFKILYFAHREHIVKYGIGVVDDKFIAMVKGPVPSKIYDNVKEVRDPLPTLGEDLTDPFSESLEVTSNHILRSKRTADLKFVAPSVEKELLDAIAKYGDMSHSALTDASHGYAWRATPRNGNISVLDIAIEGNASEALLKHIRNNM